MIPYYLKPPNSIFIITPSCLLYPSLRTVGAETGGGGRKTKQTPSKTYHLLFRIRNASILLTMEA